MYIVLCMVNTFFDLNVWKRAHSLILDVYSVLDEYPKKRRVCFDKPDKKMFSINYFKYC